MGGGVDCGGRGPLLVLASHRQGLPDICSESAVLMVFETRFAMEYGVYFLCQGL
jgi:hypothetical protein